MMLSERAKELTRKIETISMEEAPKQPIVSFMNIKFFVACVLLRYLSK